MSDRINEAYDGTLGTAFMQETRARLDWICTQVRGNSVLDIGCSQGIGSLLLARSGFCVTGVDMDADVIEYAQKALLHEPGEVRRRVRFVCGDFLSYTPEQTQWDTILFGEILEHLAVPEYFIEKACSLLKDGGTLVLTTPFGINEHPDHRQTFYLCRLYRMLNRYFTVDTVHFFGRWIGMTGTRRKEICGDVPGVGIELFEKTEACFFALEKELTGCCSGLRAELQKTQTEKEKISEQLRALEAQLRQCQAAQTAAEQQYNLLANSKLGRLTRWYWPKKDALKAQFTNGDPGARTLRNACKKIPGTRLLVRGLRRLRHPAEAVPADLSVRLAQKAKKIPDGRPGRYYQKAPYRIGLICDRFFYDSICSAADFVYLSPQDCDPLAEKLDALLVTTTWEGLRNAEWRGIASEDSPLRAVLYRLLDNCRKKKIPTLFYSKEDPLHYSIYLGIARRCDHIFTTAQEMVECYRRDCQNSSVRTLRFGINPQMHNPVGMRHFKKETGVLFSGSWRGGEAERCTDLSMLFDGVLGADRDLTIIDRMSGYRLPDEYRYPDRFQPCVHSSLEHGSLQKVHKLYDWAININTVKTSQTMFANRVLELQATGNLLISNYSVGVNSLFPTVFTVHDASEVGRILRGFTPEEIYERQVFGIRRVMTGETCFDRVAELLQPLGAVQPQPVRRVLVAADRITDRVRALFEEQSYGPKKLVRTDELTDSLLAGYDMVAFFDTQSEYGPFYLEDMINAFKYTDAVYVTKSAYSSTKGLHAGPEHEYVSHMGSRYRTVFWRSCFSARELRAMRGARRIKNGYSLDRFQYFRGDRPAPQPRDKYPLSVIVPVFNNGWHLYGKAFASLCRSTLFGDMEILLVDDGSTDGFTPQMVRSLASRYSNVRTFFFEPGGSGSASRPRNKGVELASADHIVFFDPDDDEVNDGFSTLLKIAQTNLYDIAFGNRLVCAKQSVMDDFSGRFIQSCGQTYTADMPNSVLVKTGFLAIGIQSVAIRKSLITDNHLRQVDGALGEDTLMCWQLQAAAHNIHAIQEMLYVYYAARQGSAVNTVGVPFFKKSLKCEQSTFAWLCSKMLIEDFIRLQFNYYIRYWFLWKLSFVPAHEAFECAGILYEILELYQPYYHGGEELIDRFLALCADGRFQDAFLCAHKAFFPDDNV